MGTDATTNFMIVGSPDPVGLLLDAVPEFRPRLDDQDLELPYVVFGLLAQYLLTLPPDDSVLQRSIDFLNDLAERGDSSLDDLLQVGFFESFGDDPRSAPLIAGRLGARASELFAVTQSGMEFDPDAGPCAHLIGSMSDVIRVADPDDDLLTTGVRRDAET
jgi:hypothetical protein